MHAKALEDAKAESAKVTDEAKQDSERIAAQLAEQAGVDAERIKAQGAQQVQLMRQQLIRQLRQGLGDESVQKADELVRAHVADPAAQSATVDRFLDELDQMAPSDAVIETGASARLRAASREALAALTDEFDDVAGNLRTPGLTTLADELAVGGQAADRRAGADQAPRRAHRRPDRQDPRWSTGCCRTRSTTTRSKLLRTAASQRWSAESDLVDGIEHTARLALLKRAEVDGEVDEVEDQLFRFGRVLDAEPRLSAAAQRLHHPGRRPNRTAGQGPRRVPVVERHCRRAAVADHRPAARRARRRGRPRPGRTRGRPSRRGRRPRDAAAELTDAQRTRLTEVLTRIYGHPVSVQLHVDPELLGGLSIAVGDEVIDGSIASRLAAAQTQLPD